MTAVTKQAHRVPPGVVVRLDRVRGPRGIVALVVRLALAGGKLVGNKPFRVRRTPTEKVGAVLMP